MLKQNLNLFNMHNSLLSEIRKMQQEIDAYKYAYTNIMFYLRDEQDGFKPAMLKNLSNDEHTNDLISEVVEAAFHLKDEYKKLQKENDRLKSNLDFYQ